MSTRDEAVQAMAEAMDTAYNPDRYPIMTDRRNTAGCSRPYSSTKGAQEDQRP